MLSLVRRLFRRVPPHLVGRVPVDAGVGVACGDGYCANLQVCATHAPIGGHGREETPQQIADDRRAHAKRMRQQTAAMMAGTRQDQLFQRHNDAADNACWHHDSMGLPLTDRAVWAPETTGCECVARPSPVENAKRYSRPDWTW